VPAPPGRPLEPEVRAWAEPRLRHSFADVRVHDVGPHADAARAAGVRGWTAGRSVVLATGAPGPHTLSGARLRAHELAHVARGDGADRPAGGAEERAAEADAARALGIAPVPVRAAARADGLTADDAPEPAWHKQLDAVLPPISGGLAWMHRVDLLLGIFGNDPLKEMTELVSADAEASAFTRATGLAAFVALGETRTAAGLDVAKAKAAVKEHPERYTRQALPGLKVPAPGAGPVAGTPAGAAPSGPTLWFQDPALATATPGDGRVTSAQERAQVLVESPTTVNRVAVRFAYPKIEVAPARGPGDAADAATRLSERVKKAKTAVTDAIGRIGNEADSFDEGTAEEQHARKETNARVKQVLAAFTTSSPLNVFIATEPTAQEMTSGRAFATTDTVWVSPADVGDPKKMQAAVRLPLGLVQGSSLPGGKGPATQRELDATVLHEAVHAMLTTQHLDAESVWGENRAAFAPQGPAAVTAAAVELARKYLIAQEEIFAYDTEASLYPPAPRQRDVYRLFSGGAERFFTAKGAKMATVKKPIPVTEKADKKKVTWEVVYRVPQLSGTLAEGDRAVLDLALGIYPLR
jgi:hypothetical protein